MLPAATIIKQIIGKQHRLSRYHLKLAAQPDFRRAHGKQQKGAAGDDDQESEDENAALGIGCKCVDRCQHAGANEEGAEQAKGECADRQQHGPALEAAAFFRYSKGVNQGGADQPGHERRVFHRIPEPPAAPAELIIGPPASHHDADREEHPGDRGPGARPARPGCIHLRR